jgi:glutaredoxin 3
VSSESREQQTLVLSAHCSLLTAHSPASFRIYWDTLLKYPHPGGTIVALVIYTKPSCPYCQQARDYYNSHGIPFTDYDAQTDRARRKEMLAFSGGDPTVPCIVEDGKYKASGWGDPPRG